MTRECHVRICERLGVKFPGPTRHPRPSRFHADDGGFALSCGRAVAGQRNGEECQKRSLISTPTGHPAADGFSFTAAATIISQKALHASNNASQNRTSRACRELDEFGGGVSVKKITANLMGCHGELPNRLADNKHV